MKVFKSGGTGGGSICSVHIRVYRGYILPTGYNRSSRLDFPNQEGGEQTRTQLEQVEAGRSDE